MVKRVRIMVGSLLRRQPFGESVENDGHIDPRSADHGFAAAGVRVNNDSTKVVFLMVIRPLPKDGEERLAP